MLSPPKGLLPWAKAGVTNIVASLSSGARQSGGPYALGDEIEADYSGRPCPIAM
jgi:hypothetical protein